MSARTAGPATRRDRTDADRTADGVPRIAAPYDPAEVDDAVLRRGAAVLQGVYGAAECDAFLGQLDAHLAEHPEEAEYAASSILGYYQGATTSSLFSLVGHIPRAAEMVVQPDVLGCARRALAPLSETVLVSNVEYLGRNPGAECQELHRDTLSWPHAPGGEHPIAITALSAMTDSTAENGATWVVLDSHGGPPVEPAPGREGAVQVEMRRGDVLVLRADVFHGGGANTSDHVRRVFSVGYQVAWLRPVESFALSIPPAVAAGLAPDLRELLGYSHEMVLGLYKGGPPQNALPAPD